MSEDLVSKRCVPCEGEESPMSREQVREYLRLVPGWSLSEDGARISREWSCADFKAALDFVNLVADLAEEEGHHPDLRVFSYRRVAVILSTHAIKGLSVNDFILAAKINALPQHERRGVRP